MTPVMPRKLSHSLMITLLATVVAAYSLPVRAAPVTVTMSTDVSEVRVGESFMVTIEVSMKMRGGGPIIIGRPSVDAFQPPSFDDFKIEDQSTSTRAQVGLSGSSYYHLYVIEYNYVLKPLKPGVFTIKPAAVKVKGQFYESRPITVKVLPPRTPAPAILEGQTPKPDTLSDVFVQVTADRFTAYVGQPVRVSWYLYTFSRLIQQPRSDLPEAPGFYSKDLLESMRTSGRYEAQHVRIGGRDYIKTLVFRRLYFPMRTGELTIGPRQVSFVTRRTYVTPVRGSSEMTRFSAPVKLHVLELPRDGRPGDMTEDVVGHFTMKASLASSSLRVGDAIDFSVTITGEGLLTGVKPTLPAVSWANIAPNGTPKYEETVVAGKKVVTSLKADYVLVATKKGTWTFPPIRFSYFDPDKKRYVTITTKKRTLHVAPGKKPAAQSPQGTKTAGPSSTAPASPNLLAPEIRPIRDRPISSSSINARMNSHWLVLWGFLLPILLWLGAVGFLWWRRNLAPSESQMKLRSLQETVRSSLKKAARNTSTGGSDFYDSLASALMAAASIALGRNASGLTTEERSRALQECTKMSSVGSEFEELLESIDYGRYAPDGEAKKSREALVDQVKQMCDTLMKKGRCWK